METLKSFQARPCTRVKITATGKSLTHVDPEKVPGQYSERNSLNETSCLPTQSILTG